MTQSADIGRLLNVARQMMSAAVYASLITSDESGQPTSRAVRPFPPDEDFTRIVIATHRDTRKTLHVKRNARAVLSYIDAPNRGYVTVIGKALLNDRLEARRAYWAERAEAFSAFWPGGPESDEYLLIDVTPERIELRSYLLGVAEEPTRWTPVTLERAATGGWQQIG
ncbi:MAG: pyridoxamine 5'-phosphate oxidase family protein [Acidiferrobacterales bacterium]